MSETIPIIETGTVEALRALVHRAAHEGVALVDYGRFHTGLGHAPPANRIELRQVAQNDGVIEHYATDLTVRVAAGTRLGDVQRHLAQANQFLPVDGDDDLTIGEIIQHFMYGPLRVGFGSVRDLLLGLRFVDGKGEDNHVGGRTVKNVAGYDLTRLMVGALGELGVVYEATLRTYALPEEVMTVELTTDDPAAVAPAVSDWLVSQAAPGGVSLERGAGRWQLLVYYFGSAISTAAQLEALESSLAQHTRLKMVGPSVGDLAGYREMQTARNTWRRDCDALIKVVLPPARLGAFCAAVETRCADEMTLLYGALPVHGCLFVGGMISGEQAITLDEFLTEQVRDADGFRVWHRQPAGVEIIEPFSPEPTERVMLARMKSALDPNWLFNPGRLLQREEATR